MSKRLAKKVLLIGWDAADWKVIYPLIEQGKMPTLAKFIQEGAHGKIKTLDPPLSPMLWTSMATGYRADKHGITGFVEPMADNSGLRPITSTSRKVRAIWNILHYEGLKSNIIGWWPSNPVEPINGVMVSNLFQQANKQFGDDWEMPDGTVHPENMKESLAELRVHPAEITGSLLLPFIPNLANIDKEKDKRPVAIAKILAHAATIHATSTYIQRETEWDFMAVYHDAIDHFCHSSMKFHPPYRPGIPRDLYENYKDVVNAGYMFHDMMLERTLQQVDDETTVIIVSDHGFHSDHLRPKFFMKEPAAPAQEHSPNGIICIKGPGVKKGVMLNGASVLDITPTLLSLFGLPIGENMEGKSLVPQFFEDSIKLDYIRDWEKVDGDFGTHPEGLKEDPWAAQEAMQQLIDLGYIEAPDENTADRIDSQKQESKYYVARNLIDAGKYEKGIELLEELWSDNPREVRFGQRLAACYLIKKKFKKCKELIEQLKELQKLVEEEDSNLSEKELKRKYRGMMREIELPRYIDFVEGQLLMNLNRFDKAMDCFRRVEEKAPNSFELYDTMGRLCLHIHKWKEAEEAFIKALSIDDSSSMAHHGLGLALLRLENIDLALEEFFISIALNPQFANAHYHTGEALVKRGNKVEAAAAFESAVSLKPGMTKAHRWLADLYSNELNNSIKAQEHIDFLDKNVKGEVIIVSGLPRSGTSMMMQILDAAGVPLLTDGKREADISNPKGYYEFEKVKKLMVDKSWLSEAKGKGVKIIAQLLPFLPANYNYKIIFMKRNMLEVLASQNVMLGKDKNPEGKEKVFSARLHDTFQAQLSKIDLWIESQANVEILEVNYSDIIENPEEEFNAILSFLDVQADIKRMRDVVDKKLYRNKI
ncbi:MAG: alkaline phosphatase family protein [Flavobacteriales bacterium]|nr:alkaline phosphatase family protein [Flavobacteriales bacterium]